LQRFELRKNVGAIHHIPVGKPLGLIAKKLFNVLLYKAHRQLLQQERHEISVREVTELLGFKSHNMDVLKDALGDLVDLRIEWNALGDAGKCEWAITSALAEARIADGVCTYAYAPTLRDKLANPEVWEMIDLHLQRRFNRSHTWSLYENVVRYRKVGRTREFSIALLAGLLGLKDSKTYSQFKYLKRDVLNPAMAEINEKSDIEVTLLPPKRLRRKVVAVQFEVKEREADHARHDVSERLKKFGLGQRDINMALEMHSDEKLTAILDEIEHRMEAQKINNPRAYTATVLRQFDGDVVPEVQQERESRRRSRDAESRSRALALENRRQQEREFARFQADRVAEEERTLTEAAAIRLKEAFVEHLKSEMPFVFEIYCTGGEDKPLVRHQLHQFKVKTLLSQEDQSFDRWMKAPNR
jgi:hypothetical protein